MRDVEKLYELNYCNFNTILKKYRMPSVVTSILNKSTTLSGKEPKGWDDTWYRSKNMILTYKDRESE